MAEEEFEIVVQVVNVVGYEFLDDYIVLRFTLDGHRLETERIHAKTDKVQVNMSTSWTTTKKDIKRMKAENLPIKVECFRLRGEQQTLGLIGVLLIPLRIIPTFLYKNDLLSTPRWYKFMGVPNDIVCNKPELHLNVIIQPETECLLSNRPTQLQGRIAVEDDNDLLIDNEPDLSSHFELKMDNDCLPEEEPELNKDEVMAPTTEKSDETTLKEAEIIPLHANVNEAENYIKKLEDWKNEEKDNFLTHLKKVENTFLESMFEEWQRKKHEEENNLKWTIEECERLSKKLEDGYAHMKEARRSEQEAQHLQASQKELQDRNQLLESELREEREENKALRSRMRALEKALASAEETMASQARETEAAFAKLKSSKDYYKQKWVQLIREVNKLDPCVDGDDSQSQT